MTPDAYEAQKRAFYDILSKSAQLERWYDIQELYPYYSDSVDALARLGYHMR